MALLIYKISFKTRLTCHTAFFISAIGIHIMESLSLIDSYIQNIKIGKKLKRFFFVSRLLIIEKFENGIFSLINNVDIYHAKLT